MAISGTAVLVILGFLGSIWLGVETVHVAKVVGHKTKCGVERLVGKHCDMPPDPQPQP